MPEHHLQACEVDHSEVVFDVVFPSGNEAAEVVDPCEEPLDFPPFSVEAQGTAILRFGAFATVRRDHFDAVVFGQLSVKPVRVVGLVADQPGGEFIEEAGGEGVFDEMALCRRSAFNSNGEWKTVISGESDDLRARPAASGTDGEAPFLALAKVASTNASSRLSLPCSCSNRASSRSASISLPSRIHCWKRRWQVWYGGYFSGNSRHCAPVPSTHSTPFNTARVSCQGRPRRTLATAGRSTGSTSFHCSSVNSQRPVIRAARRHQSNYRMNQITAPGNYETGSRTGCINGFGLK
jgi:hypothetical protein